MLLKVNVSHELNGRYFESLFDLLNYQIRNVYCAYSVVFV